MAKQNKARYCIQKSSTFGGKVTLDFDSKTTATFVAGGTLRYETDPGWSMVNGQIRFADGSEAWALFMVCEEDGCEMWDYGVFYNDTGTVKVSFRGGYEDTKETVAAEWVALIELATGKSISALFPFNYRIDAPLAVPDVHTGWTGWADESIEESRQSAAEQMPRIVNEYDGIMSLLQRRSGFSPQLTSGHTEIISIIRSAGVRLTTNGVLNALSNAGKIASLGTTKNYLAEMVRNGTLNNRADSRGKGYGLAEW